MVSLDSSSSFVQQGGLPEPKLSRTCSSPAGTTNFPHGAISSWDQTAPEKVWGLRAYMTVQSLGFRVYVYVGYCPHTVTVDKSAANNGLWWDKVCLDPKSPTIQVPVYDTLKKSLSRQVIQGPGGASGLQSLLGFGVQSLSGRGNPKSGPYTRRCPFIFQLRPR